MYSQGMHTPELLVAAVVAVCCASCEGRRSEVEATDGSSAKREQELASIEPLGLTNGPLPINNPRCGWEVVVWEESGRKSSFQKFPSPVLYNKLKNWRCTATAVQRYPTGTEALKVGCLQGAEQSGHEHAFVTAQCDPKGNERNSVELELADRNENGGAYARVTIRSAPPNAPPLGIFDPQ